MKPCIWSKRRHETEGVGWFRGGIDISYTKNKISRDMIIDNYDGQGENVTQNQFLMNNNGAGEGVETYFTLSFRYEFTPNQEDEVWFAHAIPSTYD